MHTQFFNESQNRRERSQQRLRSFRPLQSSNGDNSSTNILPSLVAPSSTPKHSQLIQNYHHHQFIQRRRLILQRARKAAKSNNDGPEIEEKISDNKQNQKEERMEEDKMEEGRIEKKEIKEEENEIYNNAGETGKTVNI